MAVNRSHSTWHVTLCMFNLPSWLCIKRKYMMMPVLIQGLKQLGNANEVYLRPLVDELLLLWKEEGALVNFLYIVNWYKIAYQTHVDSHRKRNGTL